MKIYLIIWYDSYKGSQYSDLVVAGNVRDAIAWSDMDPARLQSFFEDNPVKPDEADEIKAICSALADQEIFASIEDVTDKADECVALIKAHRAAAITGE